MRKLFFFRSSASSSGNSNPVPPPPTDEKAYWENPWERGVNNQVSEKIENSSRSPKDLFSKPRKQLSESQTSVTSSGLRRSLSFSSAAFHSSDGLGQRNFTCSSDQSRSPSSSSNVPPQPSFDYPVRCRTLTPERQSKTRRGGGVATRKANGVEKPGFAASSKGYHDSSGNSSYSSPPVPLNYEPSHAHHVSNKILDLYIDGEQQQERNLRSKNSSSSNGNGGGWRPPRVQSTAPASPTGFSKERPKSRSFRETRSTHPCLSSRDCTGNEIGCESPRELAKNVVERLSLLLPKTNSRDFDPDTPTTVEDIFEDYLDPHPSSSSGGVAQKSCLPNGPYDAINGCHGEEIYASQKQNHLLRDPPGGLYSVQWEEDVDVDLCGKAKEAEERVVFLSEELEQENLIRDRGYSVSALLQKIRNLTVEQRNLALDVLDQLQCRIAERASSKEALRVAKVELDSQTRRLEKEKNELQSGLEKELDRRSSDWSFKLEKYQSEEQRLRERVRELAEQNVSLQREVSSLNCREVESRDRLAHSELQHKDLATSLEETTMENQNLRKTLSELQEQFSASEEDGNCIRRNYKEKEKENKELQKTITRLQRTCSEQERTISGLRQGLIEEIEKKQSSEKFDNHVDKLKMEQVRLTGVEQILRREVESSRLQVESLRHENINLLDRLRGSGKEVGSSSFKLDQELWARVDCLQNQGILLLNESTLLCAKLLEFVKGQSGQILELNPGTEQGIEANKNGLDGYFVVESDMKVQSFKRGIENLTRSLQTIAAVLNEKSNPVAWESQSQCTEGGKSVKLNGQALEDYIGFEFKAETLLTSVLREKLCSKELEVEQLQAELATAVRGHDILRCEVQSALDTLSCVTHKMKDLELQVLKKDENINRLKCDLQDCTKELTIMRGILPKVSEERDLMWEEVKQYSEKNMLLNSEVNLLKKKIEALDEDVLLKEGQITILKDSLSNKSFDILFSPKSTQEFILE
ncbi:hypothetical protein HHK36_011672 [Tetracentron sinense]|uniref:DUF7653 domain-containing protein n=1 Tax=Tetracentron sinense TaxID=13715 RepID=A0A834ZE74_TETSI|nr:hypothetical protein HHK36_011672 [Tetracentron sinense]